MRICDDGLGVVNDKHKVWTEYSQRSYRANHGWLIPRVINKCKRTWM